MSRYDSYQTEYTSDPYEGHTGPPRHDVGCGVADACGDAQRSPGSKETTPVGQSIRISSPPRRRRAPQTNSGAAPLLVQGGQGRSAEDIKLCAYVVAMSATLVGGLILLGVVIRSAWL